MALKVYRVWAENISNVYLDVAAESKEEAYRIADEADGSEFVDVGTGGWNMDRDWVIEMQERPDEDMIERYESWKEGQE